jgi:hypothetical protein
VYRSLVAISRGYTETVEEKPPEKIRSAFETTMDDAFKIAVAKHRDPNARI